MAPFVSSFWFSITTYMLYLFRFIARYLFRFKVDDGSQKDNSNFHVLLPQEENQIEANRFDAKTEPEVINFEDSEYDGFGEKETPKFNFKFQFQTFDDIRSSYGESEVSVSPDKASATNTSKYQFLPGKDFSGFMEEPEVLSFIVKELYMNSNEALLNNKEIIEGGFLSEKDFQQHNSENDSIHEEVPNDSCSAEDSEKPESVILTEVYVSEKDQFVSLESNLHDNEEISDAMQSQSEKELLHLYSDPESFSFDEKLSDMSDVIDSNSEEFLLDRDFGGEFESKSMMEIDEGKVELIDDIQNFEETHLENTRILDPQGIDIGDRSSTDKNPGGHENFEKFEEPHFQNSNDLETEVLAKRELDEREARDFGGDGTELKDDSEKSKEPSLQNSLLSDYENSNGLDTLWEHQDLLEQLKLELRKVRAPRLPTIYEESESPKMSEDLNPLKTDEKFLPEELMEELQKFYKSYSERMRKLDILNYQKMYAIGFLQKKDPFQSISPRKSSTPILTSIFSQNFRLSKRQKPESDPLVKLAKDLQSDLEIVYVGQVCHSWEFLHWQYRKARELLEMDPYETCQYNQVAGEFQQFQVLIQRFLENEPFQGPRVQNYIKNRCVLRNLLQVPVIKEDLKDQEGRRKDAVTCSMLLEIIEESMRIFWEFLRADKDESNAILKGLLGPQIELHNPTNSELLVDVQRNLQKKEKKLKDILRSGNCIVKRFQKQHEERSHQLLFFSQVELKLVSRVLNMSRLTIDQIVWCNKKLNNITSVDGKIYLESSFLCFPC